MKSSHKFAWILMILLAVASAGCGLQPETTPSPQIGEGGFVRPTETARAWVTLAPDDSATATATPSMRTISTPLQGRIAFQSDRDGSIEIYVMNADGSSVSRLTNNPAVDVFPAWSPDGSRLAFTSDRGGFPDIYLVDPDGTNLQRLTNSVWADSMPVWSNTGREVAFISNRDGNDEIYIFNLNSGLETRVTNDASADYFPTWSPDGEWIAFTTDRDINPEIYKIRRDGTDLTRLTDDPADDANPAWSPDGARIAFTSNRNGFYELYTMGPNGEEVLKLSDFRSLVDEPSWSPDSSVIAFSSNKDGQKEIYAISADGTGLNRLTDLPTADFYPAWSPLIGYLDAPLVAPTGAPEGVCVNAISPDYGFSLDNPIKIGYDPRGSHESELSGGKAGECLPWLLGPQGQPVEVSILEEIRVNGTLLCQVTVSYSGKGTPDIMYFDIFNYEQPRAPLGYSCGSPVEYLKSITEAIY